MNVLTALIALPLAIPLCAQPPPPSISLIYGGITGFPYTNLLLGPNGALYGTTYAGGYGTGTAFELAPPASPGGTWTETVLYEFHANRGTFPESALIMDKVGNLYGTTLEGGPGGGGVVFQLRPPPASGQPWTERILHSFSHTGDGYYPLGGLVFGPYGSLYGVTEDGGAFDQGTVFQLAPPATPGAAWTETLLYSFGAQPGDGNTPAATLAMDKRGNLYGTTSGGVFGSSCADAGCGTVFQLAPPSAAGEPWAETVIHTFTGSSGGDGANPTSVTLGSDGNLYGATRIGGTATACNSLGCGTVFQLALPAAAGEAWTETVLYSFTGLDGDGVEPLSGVIVGMNGTVYGTTIFGGTLPADTGTVYWVTPPATSGGTWTETVLPLSGAETEPAAGLTFGNGVLYGIGQGGGAFQITP
jgi:uncharacterized repeat protein (TIGR03803 family)